MNHRDSQSVLIREGDRVAYNLSGDVVPGVVIDTSCASHVKIRLVQKGAGFKSGHISRVKNARSILVLAGDDGRSLVNFS